METDMDNRLSLLKKSLVFLSKSYEEQLGIYPDYVDVFDEVISDFDDAFRLLPLIMEEKCISYEAVREILACYNLVNLNLSVEERQTIESFKADPAWNLVRGRAANALIYFK